MNYAWLLARLLPNQKNWFSDLDPDTGSSISDPRPNRANFNVSAIQLTEPIHTVQPVQVHAAKSFYIGVQAQLILAAYFCVLERNFGTLRIGPNAEVYVKMLSTDDVLVVAMAFRKKIA